MTTKAVRRSVRVRRSPVPRQSSSVASGFFGLLTKLSGASERLSAVRRRR